jgi:nicotinamide mononucleotide transporter
VVYYVWFAKGKYLVYPTGLIATIITVYLLYQAGLYVGDMLINAYFSVMSIYGWYKWSRKTQEEDLPISRTNKKRKKL